MTTANIYTLAEAEAAIKGKHFHHHETITDYVEVFKVQALRPASVKGYYRIIGRGKAECTVPMKVLGKLIRDGQCSHREDNYVITDAA